MLLSRYTAWMPSQCIVAAILLIWMSAPSDAARLCQSASIFNYYHTWVRMTYSCKDAADACTSSSPYTQWNDIGFESNSAGGGLRDERNNNGGVYECSSWALNDPADKVARGANARQERLAIAGLIKEGWAKAPYNVIGGLGSFTCNPDTNSYKPRSSLNVCWTFTCAFSAYLKQVFKVAPRASGPSTFGVREALQVPGAWQCNPRHYGSGDGCQCNCGAFDPDCESMSAVATDCPNHDDVCIPGPENTAICKLRHQVRLTHALIHPSALTLCLEFFLLFISHLSY
jgi:hypothetical protein